MSITNITKSLSGRYVSGANAAVVTGKMGKGSECGKPFEWTLWYNDTYVQTAKGWR